MSFDPFGITGNVVITLLIFFLSIYARRIKQGAGKSSFWKSKAAHEKALIEQNLMIALYHNDPHFDITSFTTRVDNIFLKYQGSWIKKNLDEIRPYETAEMYDKHQKELQPFIDCRRTKVIADLVIVDTQIAAFSGNNVHVFLDVAIKARLKNFIIDDQSYKVLDGSRSRIDKTSYLVRMVRKRGVQTRKKIKPIEVAQWPNSGTDAVDINNLGRSERCGGELTTEQCDWMLAEVSVQK
jgi:predicted lipid-binding transport protein (Tim44 family)